MRKIIFIITLLVVAILGGIVYYKYFFVFGSGVKSGYLNYAVYKGNVFKTYEGKLIQEGFGNSKNGVGMESNQFTFSVENPIIFEQLEKNSGKYFELYYKEYHNPLPWRGNTVYIVDSIVNMK